MSFRLSAAQNLKRYLDYARYDTGIVKSWLAETLTSFFVHFDLGHFTNLFNFSLLVRLLFIFLQSTIDDVNRGII